jgi:hypothetical protein
MSYATAYRNQEINMIELIKALTVVQSSIENPAPNKKNDHFKNNYADLATILALIRPTLAVNGLAISQLLTFDATTGHHYIKTMLMHTSGDTLDSSMCLPPLAKPQDLGSAITYYRRYSILSMLGIHTGEDDDGNAASNVVKEPQNNSIEKTEVQSKGGRTEKQVKFLYAMLNKVPAYKKLVLEYLEKNKIQAADLSKEKFDEFIEEAKRRDESSKNAPADANPNFEPWEVY